MCLCLELVQGKRPNRCPFHRGGLDELMVAEKLAPGTEQVWAGDYSSWCSHRLGPWGSFLVSSLCLFWTSVREGKCGRKESPGTGTDGVGLFLAVHFQCLLQGCHQGQPDQVHPRKLSLLPLSTQGTSQREDIKAVPTLLVSEHLQK